MINVSKKGKQVLLLVTTVIVGISALTVLPSQAEKIAASNNSSNLTTSTITISNVVTVPKALFQSTTVPLDVALLIVDESLSNLLQSFSPPIPLPAASTTVTSVPPLVIATAPIIPAPTAIPTFSNHLFSADGTLDASVGVYGDCSANAVLGRNTVAIDTCVRTTKYFMGHNPGLFTPLMHMPVGSLIFYWDASSVKHTYKITSIRDRYNTTYNAHPLAGSSALFQTCINPDGSSDRIFDVVEV